VFKAYDSYDMSHRKIEKFHELQIFQVFYDAIFEIATWQATMNIELAVHSCICGWEGSLGKVRGPKQLNIPQKADTRKMDHFSSVLLIH